MSSMSGRQFLDTNVLVYSCDSSDAGKQPTALDLIAACSSQGTGMLSVQVLGEFFHATVVRKKLLIADEAERAIVAFRAAMTVVPVEFQDVADAIAIHRQYQTIGIRSSSPPPATTDAVAPAKSGGLPASESAARR